jgi:hypothetical protein
MLKYLFILLLALLMSPTKKVPLGKFRCIFGYDHYYLTLKKDSTFEQKNGSCTWNYTAKGKWKVNADTIKLIAEKIYTYGYKRKEPVDTSSYLYRYYKAMSEVVIKEDTLELLNKSHGKVYQIHELVREK